MNFKTIFPKYFLFFIIFLFPNVSVPMSAYEIMKKVDQRYTGETIEQTSTLVLIDKKNRKRAFRETRRTDSYRRKKRQSRSSSIYTARSTPIQSCKRRAVKGSKNWNESYLRTLDSTQKLDTVKVWRTLVPSCL